MSLSEYEEVFVAGWCGILAPELVWFLSYKHLILQLCYKSIITMMVTPVMTTIIVCSQTVSVNT